MTSAIRTRIGLGAAAGLAVALMALAPARPAARRSSSTTIPSRACPRARMPPASPTWEIDLFYDLMYNTFGTPGRQDRLARAEPEHHRRSAGLELVHQPHPGPAALGRAAPQGANTSRTAARRGGKLDHHQAQGHRRGAGRDVRGEGGETWFISFDPPCCPEAASGSIMVASRLFWALGYWQAETVHRDRARGGLRHLARRRHQAPVGHQAADDARRSARPAAARRTATPTAPTASPRPSCCRARCSAGSAITAPGPTTRTTSSRTSTAGSCARSRSSARGPTSPT